MKLYWPKACLAAVAVAFITGCAELPQEIEEPALPEVTQTRSSLLHLAPPKNRVDIAVYEFEDLSGQYKPSENFQSLSRAVSQGGGAVLIKALKDTGRGQWFRVVERTNLNNLLQERRIIQEMRQIYLKEKEVNPAALPPMLFAGVIVEGGVVGFDSNVETGGAGAALLGIGARTEYRRDTMSVNLRTVSVKTGEILASVVVQKSVLSTSVGANVFRYVASDEILELETGVTENEPGLIALSRAIEKAIYALIMEMAQQDYWAFKDHAVGQQLINRYLEEDGRFRRPVSGDQAHLDVETSIEISAVTSASETTKTI